MSDPLDEAIKAGTANDNDTAIVAMEKVDLLIKKLSAAIRELNVGVVARVAARSDELSALAANFSTTILLGTATAAVLA